MKDEKRSLPLSSMTGKAGTSSTSVSNMECDNLPTVDIESYPYPLFVGFLANEAKHLIDFGFERIEDQFLRFGFDLEVQVIR